MSLAPSIRPFSSTNNSVLRLRQLGTVPYREAWALQYSLASRSEDYVLVLEHPLTITMGRRSERSHVLVDPESIGAELIETDRGGDVTLHGPGQLIGYPIITLDDDAHAIQRHVRRLEDAVVKTVRSFLDDVSVGGIGRIDRYHGVWIGIETNRPAKIAALGVRVSCLNGERRTLHGVALNVNNDLSQFAAIVPCGLSKPVTSLANEGATASLREVEERFVECLAETFSQGREIDCASIRPVEAKDRSDLSAHSDQEAKNESMLIRRLTSAGVNRDQGVEQGSRRPHWLRIELKPSDSFQQTKSVISELGLVTVCQEARCPNLSECWTEGTATFMVNGDRCTRACGFCQIDSSKPMPIDPTEPNRVAQAVERMALAHCVVTCVARDDLKDGGAEAIAETIEAIRRRCPDTSIEVLISDLKGSEENLALILNARPDIVNHNIETVARLQRAVRPSAGYARSLALLGRAAQAGFVTKSGIMIGLGERDDELISAMADLASVGVQLVTIGQYLSPSTDHLPIDRYGTPELFDELAIAGQLLGLKHVQSSPLTRSSYHAQEAQRMAQVLGAKNS